METYIAILRGINVSGHNIIKMAELKAVFEKAGFRNIITYIQSGNIIFGTSEKKEEALSGHISRLIRDNFGLDVPVILRSSAELGRIAASNPFMNENGILKEKLHVTFLSGNPEKTRIGELEKFSFGNDRFIIAGKEIYLYCPDGYGNSKLSNTFFENKLKVTATTRNWATVNKLIDLSSDH